MPAAIRSKLTSTTLSLLVESKLNLRRECWTLNKIDFARLAEDFGAVGIRVEDPKDICGALQRALSANRPVVIDVVTDIEAMSPLAVE